ncbi:MAG: hypothetical protein CMK09_15035 [Ponticaulis sp.]|nr:hypothetical protein [Ponticaulis sp.]|tara:strand:- start:41762 stop:42469 length:708 start_codon:yes stop_codon:yes gene_type:complete
MHFNVFTRHVSRVHKIIGLVAGVLLAFWVVSGFYFTLFPISEIRGDHLRTPIEHGTLEMDDVQISVEEAMDASGIWGFQAELKMFMGDPVWLVSNTHDKRLIDARTGEKLSPLSQEEARNIFDAGVGRLTSYGGEVFLLEDNAPREYAGPLPVWVFEASTGERAYQSPTTGDILAVRTTEWRIFDVFWRFHILDIIGDDQIDSWWMKLAAFLAIIMVISGFIILVQRIMRRKLFS